MSDVNVTTDLAKWKSIITQATEDAAYALAEQMMNDSLDVIPRAEGMLRDSGKIEEIEGDVALTWETPYALYQWYGMWDNGSHKVKNYTTPGTSKLWVEKARQKNQKNWTTVFENAFAEGINNAD